MNQKSHSSLFEDDTTSSKPAKKRKHKSAKKNRLAIICACILVFLVAAACVAIYIVDPGIFTDVLGITHESENVFLDGVTVDGFSIAGMTQDEAREALKAQEAAASAEVSIPLTLDLTGDVYTIDAATLNVTYNTDQILAEAIMLCINEHGRVVEKEAEELALNGKNFVIEYTLDTAPLAAFISNLASTVNFAPVDASFGLASELQAGATPEVSGTQTPAPTLTPENTPAAPGAIIDPERDETGNEQVTLVANPFYYVTAIYGLTVDESALLSSVNAMIESKQFSGISIPYERIIPEKTLKSFMSSLVLRCAFQTEYESSRARNFNLEKAAGLINGTIVEPGVTFSINTVLGDRNKENGWKEAPAYIHGGAVSEMQYGGGVCQISSTLYNTVICAGLTVTDRTPHSKPVAYVSGGLDATIDSGRIDMQWVNSTNANIYVFMWLDTEEKIVHCEIYGEPFPDEYDTIEFISKRQSTLDALTGVRYIYNKDIPAGTCVLATEARKGSTWKSYAVYYKNGVEVRRELVDDSRYEAMQQTWLYGTGWTQPTPTPPESSPVPSPAA